jgi:hypothetical protein
VAVSEIPVVAGVAQQELQVPIEGRVYTLALRWAGRDARWYLDIFDEDRTPVYVGVAVVLNFPLAFRCASTLMWPGVLMATDTSGENAEPGLDDLGERVKLIYYDAAELPFVVSI